MKRSKRSKSTRRRPATSRGNSAPTAKPDKAIVAALALIALAAVAVYSSSFGGAFVFDDDSWIKGNSSIRSLWQIWQVLFPPDAKLVGGRPVVSLTLAANYALGGLNVWGYHAVNLAIHIMAAWTLFGVTRRTLGLPQLEERFGPAATPLALVVVLLWTVHPLQTESVTYVIQRTESLVGLFYLLTLYCVIRGAAAGDSIRWYVAATAACLLGMTTKEVMATAPLLVLLYDRTFLAGSFREALRRRWALYLAMAATWSVVAWLLISTGFYGGTAGFAVHRFTAWSYLLTQPGVIVHYLRLAIWPDALCFDYNWPPAETASEILLPAIAVVGMLALAGWALVKRPAWGFLGAWFFVILAPTSSFVPIRDAAFDHRMYLSLAALAVGLTIGCWLVGQWLVGHGAISAWAAQFTGGLLAICVSAALGILAFQRNADYQSELSIWQDTVAKAPRNDRARNALGLALAGRGRMDEAVAEYGKALALKPDYADAHINLGVALAGQGRMDEALAHCQKAVEINPNSAGAHNNLGNALASCGKLAEALAHFQKAVEIDPDDADAYNNLGTALDTCGRADEAMVQYQKALKIKPDFAKAHDGLGLVLAKRGWLDEATVHFRRAVEIEPDFAAAREHLARALGEKQRAK